MQRRHFTLSTVSALAAAAALLAGCNKPEQAAAPAPAAPAASAGPAAPAVAEASAPAATPAAAPAAATDAYVMASGGSGFSTGPMMSAHTVYVFFDTTCPHCAHLWQTVQGMGKDIKVVWMPIGLLRPQSGPQGATILAAADPKAAMATNEASVLASGKGIEVPSSLDDAVLDKVKANTELFRKFNADSVPLIVFRNAKTGQVGQHAGAVDAAKLRELAGL
jgi:thiol:disulfide interchange protein DsbG